MKPVLIEAIANADAAALAKQLNAEVRPWTTVTAVDPAAAIWEAVCAPYFIDRIDPWPALPSPEPSSPRKIAWPR